MPLPTGDVIGILADNLRLRKSVLPLSTKVATKWTEGLGLPRGGETVLYTGMMYQLIPYIEGLVKAETKLGDSWLAKCTGLGRRVNRLVNISAFMARPSAEERAVLQPGADQRRAPAAQGRRRVRRPLRGRPLLGRPGLRPGRRRGRRRACPARARGLQEARREERHHHRPAHHEHAAQRLSQAARRLRRRGAQLPRGAGRERVRRQRAQPKALSGEVVHPRLLRVRPLRGHRRRAARAAGGRRRHRPRPGERGPPDLVLRRPGGVALSRQGGGQRAPSGSRSCARPRPRRHHVPHVLRQPEQRGRRHDALQGHLRTTCARRTHPEEAGQATDAAAWRKRDEWHTTKKTIILFSGDFDKVMAAFIIANGAAAMGDDVTMFFTFWGLNILRKPEKVAGDRQEELPAGHVRRHDAARAPGSWASPR